jgi:hypothetical protein
MELEISGRQTGKTTRLADHASDELIQNINDPSYKICVVSPSNHDTVRISEMIKRMFIEKMGHIAPELELTEGQLRTLNSKIKMSTTMVPARGASHISKYYVDEFAFIPETDLRRGDNYYCTTPNSVHHNNRFTVDLLNYCRRQGIEVESYDVSRRFRNDFNFSSYVNEFDDWCIEHELEMYPHPFEGKEFVLKYIKRHRFNGHS